MYKFSNDESLLQAYFRAQIFKSRVHHTAQNKINLKLNVLPHLKRLKHFMEPIPKVLFREGRTEPIPNFNLAMDV